MEQNEVIRRVANTSAALKATYDIFGDVPQLMGPMLKSISIMLAKLGEELCLENPIQTAQSGVLNSKERTLEGMREMFNIVKQDLGQEFDVDRIMNAIKEKIEE